MAHSISFGAHCLGDDDADDNYFFLRSAVQLAAAAASIVRLVSVYHLLVRRVKSANVKDGDRLVKGCSMKIV